MLSFNSLGMSVLLSSLNHISNTDSRPLLSNAVDITHFPPSSQKVHHQTSVVMTVTSKLAFICSSQRVCPTGELLIAAKDGEVSGVGEYDQSKLHVDSSGKITLNNGSAVVDYNDPLEIVDNKILKERIRRTKIGLANKGRVPWNKGRKHTAETRERIKQRTLEALRDPKVRNKMSGHPRTHSDQIKAKISSSQRRVWQERLKPKRLREQFFLLWAQGIANGARKGGSDQEELNWDSYDKIKQQLQQQILWAEQKGKEKQTAIAGAKKFIRSWAKSIAKAAKEGGKCEQELEWDSYEKIEQEMALQYQLQRSAEKAKAKEIARIRAERAAQIKAIKKVMLTQKRKGRKERTKARGDIKNQPQRKAKEVKGDLEVQQEFRLSPKITKICVRKSTSGQVDSKGDAFNSIFPACKKLDLDLIKREKMRKEISLADQIQAARNKKGKIR